MHSYNMGVVNRTSVIGPGWVGREGVDFLDFEVDKLDGHRLMTSKDAQIKTILGAVGGLVAGLAAGYYGAFCGA